MILHDAYQSQSNVTPFTSLSSPGNSRKNHSRKRVLMIIHPTQPLLAQEMMRTRSVCHTTHQPVTMGTSSTNGIKATRTQPPNGNVAHIELRPTRHIIQHALPQTVRRLGVRRVRGTIRRTGDLDDNGRPASIENLVRPLTIVGSVPVQPGHDQDDGDAVRRGRFLR